MIDKLYVRLWGAFRSGNYPHLICSIWVSYPIVADKFQFSSFPNLYYLLKLLSLQKISRRKQSSKTIRKLMIVARYLNELNLAKLSK